MAQPESPLLIDVREISKDYRGLRPLRIARLTVAQAERVSIIGLDAVAAEVFVNLLTGATLPDRGDIHILGRSTAAITDGTDWLATVDRFGIVSERVVLLDGMTVAQNLAVPFTLELEPLAESTRQEVERLADEVGLPADTLSGTVRETSGEVRLRVRLARALALAPAILLLEQPGTSLATLARGEFGTLLARLAERRRLAMLTFTADRNLATAIGGRRLVWNPATGALLPDTLWSRWAASRSG